MDAPATKPGLFDISFRMFGMAVRIKPSYWIYLAIFGYFLMGVNDLWTLIAWVIAGVVTTLAHELGQVIVGRIFGYPGTVLLQGMGGGIVAEYERAHRWQRIAIYSAGVLASVLFFGLLYLLAPWIIPRLAQLKQWQDFTFTLYSYLLFKVVFDILLNALPILPGAGGKITTELFGYAVGQRDYVCGMLLSILTIAALVGYSLYKNAHPEAPYFGDLCRAVYPPAMTPRFAGQNDINPLFMAAIFGFSGIVQILTLYRTWGK